MKKAEMILKVMDWTTLTPGWRPFSSVLLYPLVEEKRKGGLPLSLSQDRSFFRFLI